MKKYITLMIIFSFVALIVACEEKEKAGSNSSPDEMTTEDTEDYDLEENVEENSVDASDVEQQLDDGDEEEDELVKEFNDEILNTGEVRIVLKEIKRQEKGGIMNKGYYITLEVENKLDKDIIIYANKAAADDKMIDDMVVLSGKLEAKSTKNTELTIKNYDMDMIEIEEKLEFDAVLANDDFTTTIISENPVKIDFTTVPGSMKEEKTNEQENDQGVKGNSKDFEKQYDDVIYDSEDIKVTLKRIKRKTVWDLREKETYYISLEVQNKTNKDIVFSSEKTIADGKSIDEFVVFRDTVVAKKTVDSVMEIHDYSDKPLPDIKNYIETEIEILDEESVQEIGYHTIKIDFD